MAKTKRKKENNEQFLVRLMNFSRRGAMMQAMMIEGLSQYCKNCVRSREKNPESFDRQFARVMIHGPAWEDACKEYLEELQKHLPAYESEENKGEEEQEEEQE